MAKEEAAAGGFRVVIQGLSRCENSGGHPRLLVRTSGGLGLPTAGGR